ncbi:MAG: TauD/TfdA family dioxygenase [Proteobacteria bacterium]|nr:TauD/TfdA family dioxygenase [Pseudomonadota bacterium]
MFASNLAWLPADLRARIEGRRFHHAATHPSDGSVTPGFEHIADIRTVPGADHPIIRTHPDTGRQALYLGRRPLSSIVCTALDESQEFLNRLWDHVQQDKFVYRHDRRVGDLVV